VHKLVGHRGGGADTGVDALPDNATAIGTSQYLPSDNVRRGFAYYNRVALNGIDLPDEKAVHVKITTPDHEFLGFELFRAWHSLFMISV
jgi:hypothetical protein